METQENEFYSRVEVIEEITSHHDKPHVLARVGEQGIIYHLDEEYVKPLSDETLNHTHIRVKFDGRKTFIGVPSWKVKLVKKPDLKSEDG